MVRRGILGKVRRLFVVASNGLDRPTPGPRTLLPVWLGVASFAWAVAGWVAAASASRLAFVPCIEAWHVALPAVTVALILANLGFSLHALFRRKVPVDQLLLVTGLQMSLFTTLFFQFAAHVGAEQFWIERPTKSWEWLQFSSRTPCGRRTCSTRSRPTAGRSKSSSTAPRSSPGSSWPTISWSICSSSACSGRCCGGPRPSCWTTGTGLIGSAKSWAFCSPSGSACGCSSPVRPALAVDRHPALVGRERDPGARLPGCDGRLRHPLASGAEGAARKHSHVPLPRLDRPRHLARPEPASDRPGGSSADGGRRSVRVVGSDGAAADRRRDHAGAGLGQHAGRPGRDGADRGPDGRRLRE